MGWSRRISGSHPRAELDAGRAPPRGWVRCGAFLGRRPGTTWLEMIAWIRSHGYDRMGIMRSHPAMSLEAPMDMAGCVRVDMIGYGRLDVIAWM